MSETPDGVPDEEAERLWFVEEFTEHWAVEGVPPIEGRILGYLLITSKPYVSSAELATVLRASAGAISSTTRRLVESGLVRRHTIPGDRSHYFRMDDDVWGGWLAGERPYLTRQQNLAERALEALPESDSARRRIENMRDYMAWLKVGHAKMLEEWEAFKADRDRRTTDNP